MHAQFRAAVKERRHLTDEEMEKTTDGRIMTGVQAKNAKLIDAIGGYQDAVKQAKKLAGLPDSAPVIIKEASHGLLKDLLFGDPEEESRWNHLFDVLSHAVSTLTDSSKWRVLYLSPLG